MPPLAIDSQPRDGQSHQQERPIASLIVSILAFYVVTLDAVVVNVALPTIRRDLGGGISGLQWVVDGYTLMFAAFLLTAGAVSDRAGARRTIGSGLFVFLLASLACGLAPNLDILVIARLVQGSAAALMMPSSMAMVRHAYTDPARRARAVGLWAMGGALASSSGPVLGGLLTAASWRLIFLINLPVGLAALALLRRTMPSPRHPTPIDWTGQLTGIVAMGGLTYGAIEAGRAGWTAPQVLAAFGLAIVGIAGFRLSQTRVKHPMVPRDLLRHRIVRASMAIGLAFMVGYWGLLFVFSLYFQQVRGQSALVSGALFLPMMLVGAVFTPFTPRFMERFGSPKLVVSGLIVLALGLVVLALLPRSTPLWVLALLMILPGLSGPAVTPPTTAALLNSVRGHLAGTASGVFNTSRQVGGALAIAVFGGLLAGSSGFMAGLRVSLLIAAAIAVIAAVAARRLRVIPSAEDPT